MMDFEEQGCGDCGIREVPFLQRRVKVLDQRKLWDTKGDLRPGEKPNAGEVLSMTLIAEDDDICICCADASGQRAREMWLVPCQDRIEGTSSPLLTLFFRLDFRDDDPSKPVAGWFKGPESWVVHLQVDGHGIQDVDLQAAARKGPPPTAQEGSQEGLVGTARHQGTPRHVSKHRGTSGGDAANFCDSCKKYCAWRTFQVPVGYAVNNPYGVKKDWSSVEGLRLCPRCRMGMHKRIPVLQPLLKKKTPGHCGKQKARGATLEPVRSKTVGADSLPGGVETLHSRIDSAGSGICCGEELAASKIKMHVAVRTSLAHVPGRKKQLQRSYRHTTREVPTQARNESRNRGKERVECANAGEQGETHSFTVDEMASALENEIQARVTNDSQPNGASCDIPSWRESAKYKAVMMCNRTRGASGSSRVCDAMDKATRTKVLFAKEGSEVVRDEETKSKRVKMDSRNSECDVTEVHVCKDLQIPQHQEKPSALSALQENTSKGVEIGGKQDLAAQTAVPFCSTWAFVSSEQNAILIRERQGANNDAGRTVEMHMADLGAAEEDEKGDAEMGRGHRRKRPVQKDSDVEADQNSVGSKINPVKAKEPVGGNRTVAGKGKRDGQVHSELQVMIDPCRITRGAIHSFPKGLANSQGSIHLPEDFTRKARIPSNRAKIDRLSGFAQMGYEGSAKKARLKAPSKNGALSLCTVESSCSGEIMCDKAAGPPHSMASMQGMTHSLDVSTQEEALDSVKLLHGQGMSKDAGSLGAHRRATRQCVSRGMSLTKAGSSKNDARPTGANRQSMLDIQGVKQPSKQDICVRAVKKASPSTAKLYIPRRAARGLSTCEHSSVKTGSIHHLRFHCSTLRQALNCWKGIFSSFASVIGVEMSASDWISRGELKQSAAYGAKDNSEQIGSKSSRSSRKRKSLEDRDSFLYNHK